jgi:hypothetical protein
MTMKPNLLILGAAKCGTTSLYYYLKQHSQICMAEPKEPRFFEMEYAQGMDFYWQTYFASVWNGEPAIGEAAPRNLYLPYVGSRIKAEIPDAKLIVILRNPIERAFSHWWMTYSTGVEKLSFDAAMVANWQQLRDGINFEGDAGEALWRKAIHWGGSYRTVKYRWYLDMGYYAQQLERYLELFSSAQVKILFNKDLRKRTQAVLDEVYTFLGVDTGFTADTTPQMVGLPQNVLPLLRLAQLTRAEHLVPKSLRMKILSLFSRHSSKQQINPVTRVWLIEHYAPHNRALERLTGRDLAHWSKMN